jgi:hypothetical protein
MSNIKFLKGECEHCGGRLEFPADGIGTTIDCPHCGQPTELMLETPKQESLVPKRIIVGTIVALTILVLGLIGAVIALKQAQHLVTGNKPHASSNPAASQVDAVGQGRAEEFFVTNDFRVGRVTLEKLAGSSVVYAIGTATNLTNRQRFGVQIDLELLNASGDKIGVARDYNPVMEPNAEWQFKALVVDGKTTSVRVSDIHEK